MFNELEKKINYIFKNKDLLKTSLTHPSYVNEHKKENLENNQRLEFLGDAVVELVVSNYLYKTFKDFNEGMLTKYRIKIVCEQTLANAAIKLELYKYLLIGNGENIEKVKNNNSILCDTFESIVAAIFLDSGIDEVERFLKRTILIDEIVYSIDTDYKSIIYEYASKHKFDIEYRVDEEIGPDHDKKFVVSLFLDKKCVSTGFGSSKKHAEQDAARIEIDKLELGVK